jgi:DNA-binding response OmpR family regulator
MKKILVVDDDEQMRRDISEILTKEGYDVAHTGSGEEALEKINEEDFDIVLADLIMPGISGMEVLTEIKKTKPRIRVIMITAFATVESAVEAMKKGASDYISKPFKINEVQITVKRALEEARFNEKIAQAQDAKKQAPSVQAMISSLSSPIRRAAIEYLLKQGRSSFMSIVEELGVEDHTKLSFHLRKLKSFGIVEQDGKKRYALSIKGKRVAAALKSLKDYTI